jgi:DNA mismatch repair protein MutS2
LIDALAAERRRMESERILQEQVRRDWMAAKDQAEARSRELQERTKRLHQVAHDEAIEALKAARADLERLRTGRRRVENPAAAVDALAATIGRNAPVRELPGRALAEGDLVPGARVLVVPWGGEATVVQPPQGGRVLVQAGALKTAVAVADLRIAPPKKGPAAGAPPRKGAVVPAAAVTAGPSPFRTVDNTVDLRGERVDDALARLDRFLDQSIGRGEDVLFVWHGHGTGALRAAVRQALADHPAVARVAAASPDEGGDAGTRVELR